MPIEGNAKFWCRRAMLEYLNLLYHKHAATWGPIIMFIRWYYHQGLIRKRGHATPLESVLFIETACGRFISAWVVTRIHT
jgi:hypothetical protein